MDTRQDFRVYLTVVHLRHFVLYRGRLGPWIVSGFDSYVQHELSNTQEFRKKEAHGHHWQYNSSNGARDTYL
jgi:hypothetical protein